MKYLVTAVMLFCALSTNAQTIRPELKSQGWSGNPVFNGWYADPEGIIYGDTYWIFPTFSDDFDEPPYVPALTAKQKGIQKNTINPQYLKQTFLDAFSSKDMVTWQKHPKVLDVKNISWAAYSIWAPSVIHANNKYYLFFGANDIQNNNQPGGIGVAVADKPEGPYQDAIGKPLINSFHNGAQPIDQFVFRDDDGESYLFYGGWRHCNVVRLSPDLLSLKAFPDGETFKEITPEKYVEGPFVFKRNGKYYFMWSEGGWTGPDYSVAYAIGDKPTGPFTRIGKILQQNPEVARGAGHHSVFRIPDTDEYYIVYHRRPLNTTNGNHREVCIDRMYFNPDGTIKPVEITFKGVPARKVDAPVASVRINLDDQRSPIPSGLSGIFMEEINHGFDGGIYAELVQNRSFEEGIVPPGMKLVKDNEGNLRMELVSLPAGVPEEKWPMPWPWNGNCGWDLDRELVGWTLRNNNGAAGTMTLTAENPMNEASERSLRINLPRQTSGATTSLINSGYWGMNIQAGMSYDLSFFLRPASFKGELNVRLEGQKGEVLASEDFEKIEKSKSWKKYSAKLTATGTDPKAQLVITFKGSGDLQIDWVSLFPPTFLSTPNGLRPDLAQYLADLKPDFIRYPGGCYVQGLSWESAPDWRKMVMPPEHRPGMWGYWKYRSTDGFGYHEFLQFCEQIKADAMYVAFAGMTVHPDNNWPIDNLDTLINQTLDAIEYAIGPAESAWGAQRVKMGHPEPFPLKYVEIGNEHYAAIYGDYYVKFRKAIKEKYPDITVIMSMYWSGLNRPAIERAGDQNIDMVDEHAYRDAQWIRTNFDYFDKYKRTPWKVYVGEYASHHGEGDLLCALSDAAYLMMMENNGDLVKMASYAPLFCNVNDRSWGVNLIEFDASRSFAQPAYYVQKLFNENRPEVSLGTTLVTGSKPDTIKPLLGGRVGLGSWRTQTEFRDFEIYDAEGKLTFKEDFQNMTNWHTPVEGKWEVANGVLKQTDKNQDAARIFLAAMVPENGEIRVKARRTGGSEGFLILFNGEKDDRFFFANYGAADNSFHEVQSWGAPEGFAYKRIKSSKGAIESNRWYNLRIVISRDKAEMYLDDQLLSSAGLIPLESLFASSGYDSGKHQVVVKLVNYNAGPMETRIRLDGAASVESRGRHFVISSDNLNNRNTLDQPLKIVPVEHQLDNCSSDFLITVPAYSANLLVIPLKTSDVK
jgi:alpha-L-arabinofuranosidase